MSEKLKPLAAIDHFQLVCDSWVGQFRLKRAIAFAKVRKLIAPPKWHALLPEGGMDNRRGFAEWLGDIARAAPPHFATHWRPWMLLILSTALAALYLIGRPYILFNDSDPLTYFRKAWWFIGHAGGTDVPSRGPGYPIWLILTGAASLDSWWGLVASHIAMAVLAPVLAYGILAPMSRNAGFAAGLLFMAFAISFQHMNWVMTEELFLFVELLSFLLIARYLCGAWKPAPVFPHPAAMSSRAANALRQWLRTPYPIALLLAYCTMVKPAGSPFFWLFIGVCVLFRVEPRKRYIGPVALYAAIMLAWGTHDYIYSPVRFSPYGMPQTPIQRNFADVYYGNNFGVVNGWQPESPADARDDRPVKPIVLNSSTIKTENGPASRRLYGEVTALVAQQRRTGQWNIADANSAYQLYGRYKSDAELVEIIFLRPNPFYYSLIVQAAGRSGGDRLLEQVAREHNHTGLLAYLKYLARHPTLPLKGPPNAYVGYHFFSKFYRYREFLTTGQAGMRDVFIRGLRDNLVDERYGKATHALVNSIRFFIASFPQLMGAGDDYAKDFGSRENFQKYILENPYHHPKYTGSMMGWIFGWLMTLYGEELASDLMAQAAIEIALHHQVAPAFLAGDYLGALAYSAATDFVPWDAARHFQRYFAGARDGSEAKLNGTVESGRNSSLPGNMAKAVGIPLPRSELAKTINALQDWQYAAYKWLKPLLFALALIFTLPLIMFGLASRFVTLLAFCFLVSAAGWVAAMIMPGSDPRHEDVYAFFPLLISLLGIEQIGRLWRIARKNSDRHSAHDDAGRCGAVGR